MKFLYRSKTIIFILGFIFASCGSSSKIVIYDSQIQIPVTNFLYSQDLIYSPDGNISARIPDGWLIVTPQQKSDNANIFAVVCDPDYRYMLTFTELPYNDVKVISSGIDIISLTMGTLKWRKKRFIGNIELIEDPSEINIKSKTFGAFTYSSDSSVTIIRSGIFNTQINGTQKLYECMLTQIPNKYKPLPSNVEIISIHKAILNGIKW